jgi:hypothetical protein
VYRERIIEETDLTRFQEATLHMTDRELPSWAVRLRQERVRRLWSQKITAVHLRDAADEQTRAALPPLDSIQRYVRAYEAGQHAPGDLYADTAYTTQIEKRLQRRRFLRDSTAVAIRSRVHEFNAKALTRSGRGSA